MQVPEQRAGSLGRGTDPAAGRQRSAVSTPETSEDEASPASGRRGAKQQKSPLSSQVLAEYIFILYKPHKNPRCTWDHHRAADQVADNRLPCPCGTRIQVVLLQEHAVVCTAACNVHVLDALADPCHEVLCCLGSSPEIVSYPREISVSRRKTCRSRAMMDTLHVLHADGHIACSAC